MRAVVQAYGRAGVRSPDPALDRVDRGARRVVLLAAGLALWAAPSCAQRVPDRFGPALARTALAVGPGADGRGASLVGPPSGATRGRAQGAAAPSARGAGAGVYASEVVAGSVGAALGFYAGAAAGGRSCDVVGGCGGEDPGLGRAIVSALAGAWLGTAVCSRVGGGLAGGPVGTWGARFGAAAGGVLVALGAAAVLQSDFDRPATWIPVPVVAAAVTALVVRRR